MLIEIDGSYVTAEYTVDSALLSSCKKSTAGHAQGSLLFPRILFSASPSWEKGRKVSHRN